MSPGALSSQSTLICWKPCRTRVERVVDRHDVRRLSSYGRDLLAPRRISCAQLYVPSARPKAVVLRVALAQRWIYHKDGLSAHSARPKAVVLRLALAQRRIATKADFLRIALAQRRIATQADFLRIALAQRRIATQADFYAHSAGPEWSFCAKRSPTRLTFCA
jgi:hypothetical protein